MIRAVFIAAAFTAGPVIAWCLIETEMRRDRTT